MRFATTVGWIIIIVSIIVFVVGLVELALVTSASGSPLVLLGLVTLVWVLILGIYIGILGIRSDRQQDDLDDFDRRILKSTLKPPLVPSEPKRPDYTKSSSVQAPVSTPASAPLSADELKKIMEARRREAEARRKTDETSEETTEET